MKEYDKVKTLVSKKEANGAKTYPAGTIGIVVSFYPGNKACEVEVWDETGYPEDVVTYGVNELQVIDSEG